jgi:GT2 family glycosyltransferase
MNDLWVVIPTFNRANDLLDCIDSLDDARINRERVIVVDNHSQDATVQKLLTQFPEVVLIPLDENLGAAKASNIGFEYALGHGAEYILRLDSDTVVDPEFCLYLLDKAKKDPHIGVLSPKIYYYEPPDEIWFAGANKHLWHFGATHGHRHEKDNPDNSQVREIDYVWGAAMLIKRKVLEITGGFDPDFFVYYEEVDFCLRVKELGYKLIFIPDSHVWHKVGSSANNAWTAYHWNRSKMLLYRKNAKSFIHLISLVVFALVYAIISPVFHGKSGNRGPFRHALRGLWEGFKENL